MAITIKTDATTFTPVYNRIPISVSSSNVAQPNFKFVFDLYIEGQTFGGVGYKRFKVIPEPSNSYGCLELSSFLRGFVYSTMSDTASVVPFSLGANADGTASIIKWYIKYGEEYGTTPTVYADLTTGSDKYSWNGSLDFHDWIDFTYNDYICNISNGTSGQFLTDIKSRTVSIGNIGWHHILTDTPTDIDSLAVLTYDSTGSLIQTVVKSISVAQNLTASRMYKVATAPETLNSMTGAFVSGAQPIITSSVASYTVQLVDSGGNPASEILNFTVEEPCKYEQRRIHFLNRFGSFDYYNFNLRSTRKRNVSRKNYKMDKFRVDSTGITYKHRDRAQLTHYTESQETIKITSDYLSESDYNNLVQLIESPEIYLEFTDADSNQNIKPVLSITQTNWEEKIIELDKLFLMELEITLSHKNYRQSR